MTTADLSGMTLRELVFAVLQGAVNGLTSREVIAEVDALGRDTTTVHRAIQGLLQQDRIWFTLTPSGINGKGCRIYHVA